MACYVLFVAVVECKMAVFKGVSGIMIRETAETFGIITEDNKFKGKTHVLYASTYLSCMPALVSVFGLTFSILV